VIIINPGSGPVADASEELARAAMEQFVSDLGAGWESTPVADGADGEGRWRFEVVHLDGHRHEVDMPGLPVEQVRWLGEESGSIWNFPRLYVDGSSWIWLFGLSVLSKCDGTDYS
jgi:hypothetical protein